MVAKWNEKWGDVKKGQTQLNKERTATYNEYWGLSGTEGGEDYGPRAEKVKADTEEMNKWFEQQKAAPTTTPTAADAKAAAAAPSTAATESYKAELKEEAKSPGGEWAQEELNKIEKQEAAAAAKATAAAPSTATTAAPSTAATTAAKRATATTTEAAAAAQRGRPKPDAPEQDWWADFDHNLPLSTHLPKIESDIQHLQSVAATEGGEWAQEALNRLQKTKENMIAWYRDWYDDDWEEPPPDPPEWEPKIDPKAPRQDWWGDYDHTEPLETNLPIIQEQIRRLKYKLPDPEAQKELTKLERYEKQMVDFYDRYWWDEDPDPDDPDDPDDDEDTEKPEKSQLQIDTEEAIKNQAGLGATEAYLPEGTELGWTPLEVKDGELFDEVGIADPVAYEVATATTGTLSIPHAPFKDAKTYTAYVDEGTPEFEAAKGTPSANSLIGDIQGSVSEAAIAKAATGELDPRATVTYQLEELFDSLKDGTPPPAWAAPAVRKVGTMMAQRGLGQSSMAAAAISQAIMESGIPIATADAGRYAAIQTQNLNNEQQAALQNALTFAAMDKANLSARMQAAVNNAQTFLKMDTQNLSNEQQLKTIDLQSKYQKMFNDQAQVNAAEQFNAKSEMQVEQFFSELGVQVDNANATRLAATNQFNADQTNAADRYYAKLNDAREKFNLQNESIIQQANAAWRRNINTANNAMENETNRTNALNLLGIQQNTLDKLWQRYRDEASWAVQISESAANRAANFAMLAQENDFNRDQYETDITNTFWRSIGATVTDLFFSFID